MDNQDNESKEKKLVARDLRRAQQDLERMVVRLSNSGALNEASYLRKAITEIKKAVRTL